VTPSYLLDTNIVTAVLKKDRPVTGRLRRVLAGNARVFISPVVYYEIRRGLLWRSAVGQLSAFDELVGKLEWLAVDRAHWEAAAALWAECMKRGTPANDADLLLAVQARHMRAVLVTNDSDFDRLEVDREDWIVQ
jgi:tRNA(fMet)-specific endonuclease VapC